MRIGKGTYEPHDPITYVPLPLCMKINISNCTIGIYLRWWFNGWHYYNFINGYEITQKSESLGTQVSRMFSRISKIERPTRHKIEYSYKITLSGIRPQDIGGFTGLLMAEKVEMYEVVGKPEDYWREVDITRGDHLIRDENDPSYILDFEITRKELAIYSTVYQKSLRLYIDDMLCDMDDKEVVPVNKQTNDIAEMQDRQSDFTAQFKIRKTRAMKDLFELSGEAGINTNFPFEDKECRLIQDNIEVITGGKIILDKVDEQYYYVSILSGNLNFFKTIGNLKLTDLTLMMTGRECNHTWDVATMAGTHTADLDYVYPLCEPSDDGGIAPITDDGDRVEMYGGWIWPFIKVKTIWDEIFINANYIVDPDSEILTNDIFLKLFVPISQVTTTDINKYLYSMWWGGAKTFGALIILSGGTIMNGTPLFATGHYKAPYTATYKFNVSVIIQFGGLIVYLFNGAANVGTFNVTSGSFVMTAFEIEYSAATGDDLTIRTSGAYFYYFTIAVTEIKDAKISYGSVIEPKRYLPDMTQIDFIKMICNMFGLIPEVTPRDRKIKFWNLSVLYDNIPIARDWSAYLSERDDEIGFKFGDYAQNNNLRYKDSDDVKKDNGMGIMQIDDETLPSVKEAIELPISTSDEVTILTNIFSVNISRIAFNKYNIDTSDYDMNDEIDPRIVYVSHIPAIASPPYEKTFGIRATVAPGAATDIDSPKKASSLEISFSYLVTNYASLSRLLTKTNLRSAKFNLPVYEVAGLKHYVPIYLNQYKAYFYVNKINNYVPGQLCTIDLIKL